MDINHVHFFVEDAAYWRDWLARSLNLRKVASLRSPENHTELLGNSVRNSQRPTWFVVSSPCHPDSPVAHYLQHHPPGIADVAFRVTSLPPVIAQCQTVEFPLTHPVQTLSQGRWARVRGWGDMQHTLLEYPANLSSTIPLTILDQMMVRLLATEAGTRIDDHEQTSTQKLSGKLSPELSWMIGIDHAVLNVEAGDLPRAIAQYTQAFGFRAQQKFDIHTPRSALTSQVLSHPQGSAQFPINEPASATSQIQEFLDHNRGPGIQHIALQTGSILTTVTQLRQQGLACLQVPFAYYEQLRTRPGYALTTEQWRAIAQQQVLVDWQLDASPPALLLQIFTQPIFAEPTFFFEIIERQQVTVDHQTRIAEGFGEGNFRALFEAIEREQIKRGSLKQPHQSSHQSSKF